MKRTTHILNWYLKHAQATPPPLTFPEHRCVLDLIEAALNAQDFGLHQPAQPPLLKDCHENKAIRSQ